MAAILPSINEQKGTLQGWHVLLKRRGGPEDRWYGRAESDKLLIGSIYYRLRYGGVATICHVILSPYCCSRLAQGTSEGSNLLKFQNGVLRNLWTE